ncbi:MAG: universal stress protein [Flavobacteriales bacterium]|nr:universal stress protein [Flavobacteriales bacterium]
MRKRFILLIDFSESSANLIRYAGDWAIKADVEILLVHRTTVRAPGLADIESRRQIAHHANMEALGELRSLAREILPNDLKVSYSVSEEHLRPTLAHLLAQPFQDLVLVGVKGTGLVKKLMVGSVALELIDNTGNCVVAVPKDIHAFSQSTIHVSVTEKYPLNILGLNNYLDFLEGRNVRITFFHLAGPYERTSGIKKYLKELSDLFSHRVETDFAVYEGANPFQDIKRIVTNRAEEVLVVQRGTRLLTDQLFRKFLINELVYEGHIPLVVLP